MAKTKPAAVASLVDINLRIPIAKVDKAKRLVRGVATAEVVDSDGQIVDYDTAKTAFEKWRGNIREMHQPKAVGKATEIEFDDDHKQIIVESYISKGAEDTWQKVLDETLSMYSIGARCKVVSDKVAPKGRLLPELIAETSLVDSGACPVAKFDIVKMVEGVPTDVQPAEPDEAIDGAVLRAAYKAAETEEARTAVVAKAVRMEPYHISRALAAIGFLEDLLADEAWSLMYGDPTQMDVATEADQIQTLKAAIQLVLAFLVSEFDAQFRDEGEASTKMTAARTRAIDVVTAAAAAFPILWNKLDGTGQVWFAKAGARHSKGDVEMIQGMHDSAVKLGAACAAKEEKAIVQTSAPVIEKQTAPVDVESTTPPAEIAASSSTPAPATPGVETEAARTSAATESAKVEASPATSATTVVTDAAVTTPPATPTLTLEQVQAAIQTAVDQALGSAGEKIAALEKQVKDLQDQPLPGGPMTRAVDGTPVKKTIGNEPADPLADADPKQVLAVLEVLAKNATSDAEREQYVTAMTKMQHQTGYGAVRLQNVTTPAAPATT